MGWLAFRWFWRDDQKTWVHVSKPDPLLQLGYDSCNTKFPCLAPIFLFEWWYDFFLSALFLGKNSEDPLDFDSFKRQKVSICGNM